MLGEAINGIIGPIFDATWSSLKTQYHQGLKDTELKQKQIKAKQAVEQASEKYHQNYLKRHCNIKVLPGLMKEGMSLDKIYTAVKFLRDSDLRYFSTLDNLEELYRQAGNRRFRVGETERQDGLTAANNEQYLMVLGGPGVGKSTFLRKLGLEALNYGLAHNLIPVFIELKAFKSQKISLQQMIAEELKISGFPYAETLVKSMLSGGKMLILLDGLDEVPSNQVNDVIKQIKDFCDQHSQNHFVTSCRVAAYKGGFNQFTDVTIAEFDDTQIQQFVKRWFSSNLDKESETAERFWNLINQSENASAKELAQTPLLLTFLCLVYDRSQSLPPVRSDLYGKALNILLEDWAAEKRIERDPIYQGFHAGLEKELLSEIAYQSFKDNQLFFSAQDITQQIAEFLADTLDAPKHLNGTAVLNAIEVQQGILVERATNAYSFSHLTLQEYLTARYISSRWLIEEIVSKYLTDMRWREVFLLMAGLVRGRNHELLVMMEKQTVFLISSPKLQNLLRWAMNLNDMSKPTTTLLATRAWLVASGIAIASDIASITFSSINPLSSVSPLSKISPLPITSAIASGLASDLASPRVLASGIDIDINSPRARTIDTANNIASNILDRACNISLPLASARARALASDIAITSVSALLVDYEVLYKKLEDLKEQMPSDQATASKWQKFADQLLDIFLKFFGLDKELINFSFEEVKALENYLYTVKLIIDCKNAAVRVSRKEWEVIESRLLTPLGSDS